MKPAHMVVLIGKGMWQGRTAYGKALQGPAIGFRTVGKLSRQETARPDTNMA